MANDGYLKITKANFPAKHAELLEIYRKEYNQPDATEYTEFVNDVNNSDDCWLKIEPKVSNFINSTDRANLRTLPEAIAGGMEVEEE